MRHNKKQRRENRRLHKMGQSTDLNSNSFMNPTKFVEMRQNLNMSAKKKANMANKKKSPQHAHMGMSGAQGGPGPGTEGTNFPRGVPCPPNCNGLNLRNKRRVRKDDKKMKLRQGKKHGMERRLTDCSNLKGQSRINCRAIRRRGRLLGGSWLLVKQANGQCACTQQARGNIVLGHFQSFKECEDHRSHDC